MADTFGIRINCSDPNCKNSFFITPWESEEHLSFTDVGKAFNYIGTLNGSDKPANHPPYFKCPECNCITSQKSVGDDKRSHYMVARNREKSRVLIIDDW